MNKKKGNKESMKTETVLNVTPAQLRQAADQLEQIQRSLEAKQNEIVSALAGKGIAITGTVPSGTQIIKTKTGQVRTFTPASRAKIAKGQKARWAKYHAEQAAKAAAANGGQTPVAPNTPAQPAAPAPVPAPAPVAVAA